MLVLPPDVKLTGRLAESAVQDWAWSTIYQKRDHQEPHVQDGKGQPEHGPRSGVSVLSVPELVGSHKAEKLRLSSGLWPKAASCASSSCFILSRGVMRGAKKIKRTVTAEGLTVDMSCGEASDERLKPKSSTNTPWRYGYYLFDKVIITKHRIGMLRSANHLYTCTSQTVF